MDAKIDQLREAMAKLGSAEAVTLARTLETQRALGQTVLPVDLILAALRPQLRKARPPRIPNLLRLACAGFEDFLTDGQDAERLTGLVPRSAIGPWWQSLLRVAPQEIKNYEAQLAAAVQGPDKSAAIENLGHAVRRSARFWTEAILAMLQDRKLTDPEIRKFMSDIGLRADFAEIAHILAIEEPLGQALDAVTGVAARLNQARGRRILDFGPDIVTETKNQYLSFTEAHGLDVRYVALGLMNRLDRPWEVLRLGRALSWKPTDTMMYDTELGIIGQRLIRDLAIVTSEIELLAPNPRAGAEPADYARLLRVVQRYLESAEGMLGEFGFRRDSGWGEKILETRTILARAFDAERLSLVARTALAVLPVKRGPPSRGGVSEAPDYDTAPAPETIELALDAAHLLHLLVHKGDRHGLANPARAAIEAAGTEINNRTGRHYDELGKNPRHAPIAAQLNAVIRVCEVLFDDGRAKVMARRLHNLRQVRPKAKVG